MEHQRLNPEGACCTDCRHMEQQRLHHERACCTDCWRMEQQRLHHERACCTDCWRMEQQRLHHEGACCTDCWRMEQQRLHHEGACCTDCWHMEQQRLHHEGACCTDCWHKEQQRLKTEITCSKCQCQRYSTDCTYVDHGVLDHSVKRIKPFVCHDNDVVKITQMTGGIINIYNHLTTEGKKSCDHVRSNNNQETEEICLKERRKTNSKWKRNPFHKLFSFCRKKRNPGLSPERPRNPIQTIHNKGEKIHIRNSYSHKAAQNTTDKDSILNDRTDGANIQVGKADQVEESQLTQCHSSHLSSKPKELENTARCQKESPLNSNKWTTENKRNIDSPSEQSNRESEESFKNLSDVFSVRRCYDSLSLQESNTDSQKRQSGTCEVFEQCKPSSSCDQLQNETSKEFETQIKRHKRTSTVSSVNLEKNLFFDVDGESVFDDENDNNDLLRDHNEDTYKKQTPCHFDRCELATEVAILKLPGLMHIQEETEAKAPATVRRTSTQSSTPEQILSSGYPWDTNFKNTDRLSTDICYSGDFTKYTETSLESTNCFQVDVLRKSSQVEPARIHKVIDIDAEKIKTRKKSLDVIHVVQTTNEENSCSYDSGKNDQSSRILDGEEGGVCNKSSGNDNSIDLIDLRSYELNCSQCDKSTNLDLISSNLHRLSNSKDVNSERQMHEKIETDGDTRVDLLPQKAKTPKDNDYTTETLSTSESKGLQLSAGCGNKFSPDFPFEHKDVCFINSYKCSPLIAICLDEGNFSVIKVSDEGMLQKVEFVLNKDYHMEDCYQPERNRIESKDHYVMITLRLKDTNDENDDDNVCDNYDEDDGGGGGDVGNYDDEYGEIKARNACFPSHKRLSSGKYVYNSDTQKYVDSSSKPNESTKTNKMKRRKRHYSCHTKVPKPEITSAFFQGSTHHTSSVFPSGSSKLKSDQRKKNKKSYFKRSWQKDGRLFGWQLIDSGIGTSDHSETNSTQQLKENENRSYIIKFKTGNFTEGISSSKILPYLVKKKSDFQQLSRKFITKRRRKFVKNLVTEIHNVPRRTVKAYGLLDTYFKDVFNGTRFTEQSRLHYELLRLESFRNYSGNGSALVLARNGFYHDHNEGPRATRCYLCNAQNSNWEMFDDVRAEHRRQSPDCPFNSDSGQGSQNIPITDNSEASLRTPTHGGLSTASNNTAFTTARLANLNLTETSEVGATAIFQRPQISGDLSTGSESISQQPSEDRESRDRSLFALPKPRPQKAIGRPGQSYSTILAPKRNNVAKGAESNVGLDPTEGSSGAPGASNSNRIPSNQSQSVLAGPVAAGAFAGLSTRAQIPVSSATEALQGSRAPSAATSTTEGSGPEPRTGGEADPSFTVVVDNPRHPTYQNIETRTNSYQGWPDYLDQSPSQMAEAGFFFVGVADFTRCFCCGGGLRNWEPGDDPMLEHTRWFPRCEYVNKLKGERYVAAVQRRHQEHMAEQQRQQVELAQRRDEHRDTLDPMTTEVAEVLLEMGYSAERIREAILAVRQQRGLSEVTAQQVLTWLLDDEEQRLNINTETGTETSRANTTTAAAAPDVQQTVSSITVSTENTSETGNEPSEDNETVPVAGPVNSSNNSPSIHTEQKQPTASTSTSQRTGTAAKPGSSSEESEKSKLTANGANNGTTIRETKKKKTRKKTKGKGSGTASSAAGELDAKSLKAENEKLREMQTCKICMERPVNTTLLPCGHLVCCGSCAPRLQRCPICRKTIKGTVKTFMS